jgi:TPR repeat protein
LRGNCWKKGFGVEMNYKKAFESYMKASQKNDIYGYYEIGSCYYQGYGVEKDEKKAIEYYQRAADKGLNRALYKLADNCTRMNKDFKSFEFSKKAAKGGFVPSQFVIAERHSYGSGVKRDIRKALKWYKLYQENDGASDISKKVREVEDKLVNTCIYVFLLILYNHQSSIFILNQ